MKDVQPLGDDIIHSVTNPTSKFTAAIHIYGGDFFAAHRSEWDPDTLSEQPSTATAPARFSRKPIAATPPEPN